MCLVLKLDNGKVVSIANKQTESHSHPVPYYNIDTMRVYTVNIIFLYYKTVNYYYYSHLKKSKCYQVSV